MSKKLGFALAIIGFILIILNAIDYIGGFFDLSLEIRTSIIVGIVLVMIGLYITNKKNHPQSIGRAQNNKLTSNTWQKKEDKLNNFLKVKTSLISYYQNIGSAQTVRLLGFSAGVFTLIGATELNFNRYFSDFTINLQNNQLFAALVSLLIFIFLFGSIFILFFFVFRAIFRYATYANLADSLIHVTIEQTESASGTSLHHQIVKAHIEHLKKHPRKVFGLPLWFFYSTTEYKKKLWWGVFLCILFSIFATFLIGILIW